MQKFEDDEPSEKYEVTLDWNDPDAKMYISQVQWDLIDRAVKNNDQMVTFKDGTKLRLSGIKLIKRKQYWMSAEEKKEQAKNEAISDLWWKYIHAEVEHTLLPVTHSFRDFLSKECYFSDEKIQKIKDRLVKTQNEVIKL